MRFGKLAPLALAGAVGLSACVDEHPTAGGGTEPADLPSISSRDGGFVVPGQLIVRFEPGVSLQAGVATLSTTQPVTLQRQMLLERTALLNVPRGREREVAAVLSRMPNVEFAEPDYALQLIPCEYGACEPPNDPFFGYKWDHHNDGTINNSAGTLLAFTGKVDADIDFLEAFDALGPTLPGSAAIAILDSGIFPDHDDLQGKVVRARNFAPCDPTGPLYQPFLGPALPSCQLTPVPDRPGFFFVGETDPSFTLDRDGHGTIVAGVAAAYADNGLGVTGVGYSDQVKLINAKVCETYNLGTADSVDIGTFCLSSAQANAIVWSTDNGANVLNLSLGGDPAARFGSRAVQEALRYARNNNVLPVCATGNNALDSTYVGGISFPARFEECVAVGATDWNDDRASYSNLGRETELTAPGGDGELSPFSFILSTYPFTGGDFGSTYVFATGTSFATPQVAGLAGLLYATGLTDVDNILRRMRETADDLGPDGRDELFGFGRINACRALDPAQVRIRVPRVIRTDGAGDPFIPVIVFNEGRFDPTRYDAAELQLGDGKGLDAITTLIGDEFATRLIDADGDGDQDLAVAFNRFSVLNSITGGGSRVQLTFRGEVGCRRVIATQQVRLEPALP